jgi:hypothetical protein
MKKIYRLSETDLIKIIKNKLVEHSVLILEASKKNKQLYIQMWGGEPEREKFKKPFNNL